MSKAQVPPGRPRTKAEVSDALASDWLRLAPSGHVIGIDMDAALKIATARGYDLTLIEAEVLDSLTLPEGRTLGYAEARRNIVTHGIDLNALVGRRFRVGTVECLGQRLCEPCSHLERLTAKGALRGLIHRGGLRADVLSDGEVTTGALIETID